MQLKTKIFSLLILSHQIYFTGLAQATVAPSPLPTATFEEVATTAGIITANIHSGDFIFSTNFGHAVQTRTDRGSSNGTHYLAFAADSVSIGETFSLFDQSTGGYFDLTHIDIGGWLNFDGNTPRLTITGIRPGQAPVNAQLSLTYAFTTFTSASGLADFTGVTSVTLSGVSGFAYIALDNINYVPAIAPVPEPETYALMLGGLALIGWATRGRLTRVQEA
jgi:hypothetical protein